MVRGQSAQRVQPPIQEPPNRMGQQGLFVQNSAPTGLSSSNQMKINNFMVENSSKARDPRNSNFQENIFPPEQKSKNQDQHLPMKLSEIIQNKNQFSAVIAKPKIGNTISLNRKKVSTPLSDTQTNPLGQRALSSQGPGTKFKQLPIRLSHTHEIDFSGTGGSSNVIPSQSLYQAPFISNLLENGEQVRSKMMLSNPQPAYKGLEQKRGSIQAASNQSERQDIQRNQAINGQHFAGLSEAISQPESWKFRAQRSSQQNDPKVFDPSSWNDVSFQKMKRLNFRGTIESKIKPPLKQPHKVGISTVISSDYRVTTLGL